MAHMWRAMSAAEPGQKVKNGASYIQAIGWGTLVANVAALPPGQLWRHNQAGDLPHADQEIDRGKLDSLVDANAASGARGFTYTHHASTDHNLAAISHANARGFTVNLSANSLAHADTLAATGLPVAVVLPASVQGNVKLATPAGNRVVVCPATYRDDVTCKSCGLCARADRKVVVGFPAHGSGKGKVSSIAA
jgi:hypothetical protein